MKKNICLSVAMITFFISSYAGTTYYSRQTGNWNSNSTWSTVACGNATNSGTYPQAGDDVIICAGHNVTGNTTITVNSITIQGNGGAGYANNGVLYVNNAVVITITNNLIFDNINFNTTYERCLDANVASPGTCTVQGNFIVNSNCNKAGIYSTILSVTGTTTINGYLNFTSNAGAKTFTGDVTVNSGGKWDGSAASGGGPSFTFGGGFINNGTFTAGGSPTYTFNGSAAATYTIGGTSAITYSTTLTLNTATYVNTNALSISSTAADLTGSGTLVMGSNSSLTVGRHSNGLTGLDASTNTPNTVNYIYTAFGGNIKAPTGPSNAYYDLNITGNGGTMNLTGATTISHNLSLSTGTTLNTGAFTHTVNGTTTLNGTAYLGISNAAGIYNLNTLNANGGNLNQFSSNGTINVAGTFSVVAGTTCNIGVGTMNFNGATNIDGTISFNGFATGTKTFVGLMTIGSAGSWNFTGVVGTPVFQGGITNNGGTFSHTPNIIFNTNNQSLSGSGDFTFNADVYLNSITVTNNSTGTVYMSYNNVGNFPLNTQTAAGTWVQGTNSTLKYGGYSVTAGVNLDASTNANTVDYYSSSGNGQNIIDPSAGTLHTYYNLTISGSNTKNVKSNLTINNNLTVNGSCTLNNTYVAPSYTVNVSGVTTVTTGTIACVGACCGPASDPQFNLQNVVLSGGTLSWTANSNANTSIVPTYNIAGTLTVNSGTSTLTNCSIRVTGTATVNGTLNMNLAAPYTNVAQLRGNVSIPSGGTFTTSGYTNSNYLAFRGGMSVDGIFSGEAGTFQTTTPQTLSGTGSITFANGVVVNAGITVTNNHSNVSMTNTGAGTLSGAGTWAQGTGTLHYAGSTITITNFSASTSGNTVDYNGNVAQAIFNPNSGTASTYYNLSATSTSAISYTKTIGFAAAILGNVLIENPGTNQAVLATGANNISVGGNWTCNSAAATPFTNSSPETVTFNGSSGSQTIGGTASTTFYNLTTSNSGGVLLGQNENIANNLSVNNGAFDLIAYTCNRTSSGGTLTTAGGGTLRCGGNSGGYTGTNSNYPNNFTTHSHSGTVEFYGSNAQTVPALIGANAYSSLLISNTNSSGASLIGVTSITSNITVSTNALFDLSTFTANRLAAGGTLLVVSTGTLVCGSNSGGLGASNHSSNFSTVTHNGTVIFNHNGGGTQTIPTSVSYNNVIISNAPTKNISGTLTINGNLTINTGSTLDANGANNININGNWTDNGTFNAGTGTVAFNGSTNQNIGGSSSNTFYNININNGSTLTSAAIVTSTLGVNAILTTSSSYILTLNSTANYTGSASNQFINGPMQKLGILAGNSFTFPVGKTTNWMRIGIAMDAATTTSDFQAEYFNSAQGSTTVNAPLDHVSDGEYWDLHELNGTTGSGVISLYSQNPANSQIDDCASLTVAHYNGSAWDDLGQTGTNGFTCANPSSTNNPGNIDASSSIGNFSPFTFASHSAGKNPLHGAGALPVELISFSAKCNSNKINLSWSTASETNNDYFEIQKKEGNSESWTVAGKIKGAGNASTIHNYEFADESGNSETYYRLKQTDFNGSFTYSNIIIASCSGVNEFLMDVYPNPASSLNDLTVELKGKTLSKALIVVRDVLGKEYYSKTVVLENGNYFFSFEHSEETPSGIYFITASSNNSFVNKKIVIK